MANYILHNQQSKNKNRGRPAEICILGLFSVVWGRFWPPKMTTTNIFDETSLNFGTQILSKLGKTQLQFEWANFQAALSSHWHEKLRNQKCFFAK